MGNYLKPIKPKKMLSDAVVIVVLGCTGTGKSKLAIELAKHFNGEIISADSMQVYKGLDIITNKVTDEEQKEAIHHCIDIVEPLRRYTVVDFRNHTLPIITDIIRRNKLPIIVGGTNYYIESLLWNVLINTEIEQNTLLFDGDVVQTNLVSLPTHFSSTTRALFDEKIRPDSFSDISGAVLHKSLQEIDPAIANTLHPEDRRKIIRSLQVYQQHGQRHSDLLHQQRSQKGGSASGGPLRFQKAAMLWLQCDMDVLGKRLDDRVDDMLQRGLLTELLEFHKNYNEKRIDLLKPCYTEGIFQSIGFKEFHDYLVLPKDEKESDESKEVLDKGIEDMKLVTRQYARKQTKWVINRFLRRPSRQLPPVYGLSATNLDAWKENVLLPAIEIVDNLLQGSKTNQSPLPVEECKEDVLETHYCDVCEKVFVGRKIWEIHLKSKRHHKVKSGLRKKTTHVDKREKSTIAT